MSSSQLRPIECTLRVKIRQTVCVTESAKEIDINIRMLEKHYLPTLF